MSHNEPTRAELYEQIDKLQADLRTAADRLEWTRNAITTYSALIDDDHKRHQEQLAFAAAGEAK